MLLTITTTHRPATDLGLLLAKNPARCQSFSLPFGEAHVFYPVADEERCTAALLLDLDPVQLVRGRGESARDGSTLAHYVNDRPYVTSSFLSVAIARVYASALRGQSRERPDLAGTAIPLEATLAAVASRGGEGFIRRLFEPLGYAVVAERHPLDERFPEWGDSPYFSVTLRATCRLHELLTHLYVLLPVLDNDKHYWVGQDELEKLLARGEGWLGDHPAREQIVERYLKHQRRLVREALARLVADEDPDPDATAEAHAQGEEELEERIGLGEQRAGSVLAVLREAGARRVIDLGCGSGKLLQALLADRQFEQIAGMDVAHRALELASERLHLERLAPRQRQRVNLFQGSLTYRDRRLAGYDAASAVEVVEHVEPSRLDAFERAVFEFARPGTVVITTPNVEYNQRFERLPAGRLRHPDHRFEWTRAEFQAWSQGVASRTGYGVRFLPVGPLDAELGSPTQMAVFTR